MWQKCPICNGYKIINELTGLPPIKNSGFHKLLNSELNNLKNLENPK